MNSKNQSSSQNYFKGNWEEKAGTSLYTGDNKDKVWRFPGNDASGKPTSKVDQPNVQSTSNQKGK